MNSAPHPKFSRNSPSKKGSKVDSGEENHCTSLLVTLWDEQIDDKGNKASREVSLWLGLSISDAGSETKG
jgi:hypothetical protein